MVKANELRIGNYIKGQTANGFVVVISLSNDEYVNPLCKPIPLTEEWLLRFGFTVHSNEKVAVINFKNHDVCENFDDAHIRIHWGNKKGLEVFYNGTSKYNGGWVRHIHYVHQLQNLYFALTGQELLCK